MCVIACFRCSYVIIKRFLYMNKKSRQKLKYLEYEKNFLGEIRAFFISFKGLKVSVFEKLSEYFFVEVLFLSY